MLQDPERAHEDKNRYTFSGKMIFYKNCIFLIPNSRSKKKLLADYRSSITVGYNSDFKGSAGHYHNSLFTYLTILCFLN